MSRYLVHSNEYNPNKKVVLFPAFVPSKKTHRTSVYWSSNVSENEMWAIAATYVAPARGPIAGRADLNSLAVYQESAMFVTLTGMPHARHADIAGWDSDRRKARLQAMKLADASALVMQASD